MLDLPIERRSATRYPLTAQLFYCVVAPGARKEYLRGRTINMSRNGLLFDAGQELEAESVLEAAILWPAHPKNSERWLLVRGTTVRVFENTAAMIIRNYSFETKRPA